MITFSKKRTFPISSAVDRSWRRFLLPALILGLLLTIVPIVAAVRADHGGQATVFATVTPNLSGPGSLGVTLSSPLIVPQGAPFTATATLTNSGSTTIENAGVTIQPPVGITLSGNASIYVPDIAPGGSQEATWLLTADSGAPTGDYIILAHAHGNEVGTPNYTLIAEDTVTVGVVLPAASDDGDGIAAEVDTLPAQFSNDFSDVPPFGTSATTGTTTGTITNRGDQILAVTDDPDPKGVLIVADPSGGATAATVSACSGATSLSLTPGDWVVVTCSSAIIQVVQGNVEVSFFGVNGELATASLNAGNSLTFKAESVNVIAPLDNLEPVIIRIKVKGIQQEFELVPGATTGLIKGKAARLIKVKIKDGGVNPNSNRPVPVAILGDSTFAVIDVDIATLTLGPNGARPTSGPLFEDMDGDGDIDLVLNFHAKDAGINVAGVSLCLSGETLGGVPIGGCGTVSIVIVSDLNAVPPVLIAAQSDGVEGDGATATEEATTADDDSAATDGESDNKAPHADAQKLGTASGTPLAITLTGSDKETCDLAFTIVEPPANGTLSVVSDADCVAGDPTNTDSATVTYTANEGFSGKDSFTFLVSDGTEDSAPRSVDITVEAIIVEPAAAPAAANKAPKADAQKLGTASDTPLAITLTGRDNESCDLAFTIVESPANGTLSVVSDADCVAGDPTNTDSATVTYIANEGFSGEDSFTFLVNDGTEDSAPRSVDITVEAIIVEPAAAPAAANKAPKADAQQLETASDTPLAITLTGRDNETCDLAFTIVESPANGTLSVVSDADCVAGDLTNTDSATVTYTANEGFSGEDSFTFLVNDGTEDSAPRSVDITVEALNPGGS